MFEDKDPAFAGEGKAGNFKTSVIVYWTGAALSLSLVVGAISWSYKLIVRDINQIPIVRAQEGPLRVAPTDPGGLTAANQGLSVTQLAVNEQPLLSDEIYLAPAAEILNNENLETKIEEKNKPSNNDKKLEIKEVNAENNMNLKAWSDQVEINTGSENEVILSEAIFSQKKLDIQNAVSMALSITDNTNVFPVSLRPKIRPISFHKNSYKTLDQAVSSGQISQLTIGSAVVQLGAFDNKGLAESEWKRLENLLGSILITKQMIIQKAASGGKVFYRLRASGFDDIADARQFCTAINDKVACIPVVTR